jgi:hypothetical protein
MLNTKTPSSLLLVRFVNPAVISNCQLPSNWRTCFIKNVKHGFSKVLGPQLLLEREHAQSAPRRCFVPLSYAVPCAFHCYKWRMPTKLNRVFMNTASFPTRNTTGVCVGGGGSGGLFFYNHARSYVQAQSRFLASLCLILYLLCYSTCRTHQSNVKLDILYLWCVPPPRGPKLGLRCTVWV